MKTNSFFVAFFFCITLISCSKEASKTEMLNPIIENVSKTFAPDKRVAVFKVEVVENGDNIILIGETNMPEAKKAVIQKTKNVGFSVQDDISLLPDGSVKGAEFGVVTISVANLRSAPKHSAELATQATLGTPLNVLKKKGGWYLVQTPDRYIAWVDKGGISTMDKASYTAWLELPKIIYKKPFGYAYSTNNTSSQTISDMVGGNVLTLLEDGSKFYKASFPDGRTGFVSKEEAQPLESWLKNLETTENSLVNTAKLFLGTPYLWGGTSFKGVDCSGFTKSIYFMNGMILPRDASQQVFEGEEIDTEYGFDKLLPGDLLFFGRKATFSTKAKIIHVGMWIGNNEFIHSSGKVRVSSMDASASNFDEFEKKRFIRAKRVLTNANENVVNLKESNIFQHSPKE